MYIHFGYTINLQEEGRERKNRFHRIKIPSLYVHFGHTEKYKWGEIIPLSLRPETKNIIYLQQQHRKHKDGKVKKPMRDNALAFFLNSFEDYFQHPQKNIQQASQPELHPTSSAFRIFRFHITSFLLCEDIKESNPYSTSNFISFFIMFFLYFFSIYNIKNITNKLRIKNSAIFAHIFSARILCGTSILMSSC